MKAPLLEVRGLTVTRRDGAAVIEDVSLSLCEGEVLGIVGESGSGKSTLALALLGYAQRGLTIAGGTVTVAGTDLLALSADALRKARRERVAYVAQDPGSALNPVLTLEQLLTEGLDGTPAERKAIARDVLNKVGLPTGEDFLGRKPRQLSGGQQQRVAIAMAVVARPKLIILDEPTTGLDVSTRAKVLDLVRQLCLSDRLTAIYVSHDLAVIANVADRITVMYGGQVVEEGPAGPLLDTPRHPYTRALLDAVPSVTSRSVPKPIRGRVPPVGERSAGCVFADRCDLAIDTCCRRPALRPVENGLLVRCVRAEERVQAAAPGTTPLRAPGLDALVPPVLEATGINAFYGSHQVLFDVGLAVRPGRCLAVVGFSGRGKSTPSRCLIGLHRGARGLVQLDGKPMPLDVADRSQTARNRLQYIFQNPNASLNPRRTIGDSLSAALMERLSRAERQRRIAAALERVGMGADVSRRWPQELSGGQRQRVSIARALLADPAVLLCDEVTSSLDVSVQAAVIDLLRSLLDEGRAMLFVTHDLAVVRNIADSVMVLKEGRVVEQGSTDTVLQSPRHAYTRTLLSNTLHLPERSAAAPAAPAAVAGLPITVQHRGEEDEQV